MRCSALIGLKGHFLTYKKMWYGVLYVIVLLQIISLVRDSDCDT